MPSSRALSLTAAAVVAAVGLAACGGSSTVFHGGTSTVRSKGPVTHTTPTRTATTPTRTATVTTPTRTATTRTATATTRTRTATTPTRTATTRTATTRTETVTTRTGTATATTRTETVTTPTRTATVTTTTRTATATIPTRTATTTTRTATATTTTLTATIPIRTATATTPTQTATTTTRPTKIVSVSCNASDLKPSYLGSNGAAGTIELGFELTNTGSAPCQTYGWPQVEFLSSDGAELPTDAVRTTSDLQGATPVAVINLNPGQGASFRILSSEFGAGGGTCETATELQIYAPYDTVATRVKLPGGVPACGKTTVSPMMSGTSAFSAQ